MRCAQHFCTHKRDGSLRLRAYPDDLTAQHSLDVAARFMMAIKDQYPFPGVAHSEWVRHGHRRAARRLRACWCNGMHACSEQSLWHPARARADARQAQGGARDAAEGVCQAVGVRGRRASGAPSLPAGLMGAPCAACSVVCFLHGVVFMTRLRMVQPLAPVPDMCIPGSLPS